MTEAIVGLWIGLMVAIIAWGVTDNAWKADTVERGLAMHCPTDGQWAWNGECGK